MQNIIAILAVPSNHFLCGFHFKGIESLISVGSINYQQKTQFNQQEGNWKKIIHSIMKSCTNTTFH